MTDKVTAPVTVVSMRSDVYQELEKRFAMNVQRDTTPEQIAVMLGQQMVLKELRNGFVSQQFSIPAR